MLAPVTLLRYAGRITFAGVIACGLATVAMQFEGIIAKNVTIARELSASRTDIAALRVREREQLRTIRRLQDPHGAIPEIHEKLRLVAPNEEIYYVRQAPQRPPAGQR